MEERPEIHYLQYGLLAACFRVRIASSQNTIAGAMICNQEKKTYKRRDADRSTQLWGESNFFTFRSENRGTANRGKYLGPSTLLLGLQLL